MNDVPKTLDEVYTLIRKWLHITNTDFIDVILATAISNQYLGKPLWMFLIGQSGDGKSEIVVSLDGIPNVIRRDQITPNTLATGLVYKGNKVPDLGQQLQDSSHIIIFEDLASLITMNTDKKKEIWGQFRTLYDGRITKQTGSGVDTVYKGCHVTMIACATDALKNEVLIHQQLGSRELLYEIPRDSKKDNREKMNMSLKHFGKESDMKYDLMKAVQGFLHNKKFVPHEVPSDIVEFMFNEALRLAILRAAAPHDWSSATGELHGKVSVEISTRLVQQMHLLYQSLKSLDEDYPIDKFKKIIENIVKTSSVQVRYDVLEFFETCQNDYYTITDLHRTLKYGRKSISAQCEVLWSLDILEKDIRPEEVGWEGSKRYVDVAYYKYIPTFTQEKITKK
jgi:hypothetical protein